MYSLMKIYTCAQTNYSTSPPKLQPATLLHHKDTIRFNDDNTPGITPSGHLRTLYDSTTMARIICSPYGHYGGINVSWIGLVCRPHTRLTNLGVLQVQASPKGKLHPRSPDCYHATIEPIRIALWTANKQTTNRDTVSVVSDAQNTQF